MLFNIFRKFKAGDVACYTFVVVPYDAFLGIPVLLVSVVKQHI